MLNLSGGVAVIQCRCCYRNRNEGKKAPYGRCFSCYKRLLLKKVSSAGGGSAYIHASKKVAEYAATLEGDEKTGAGVVLKALEAPLFHIAAQCRS